MFRAIASGLLFTLAMTASSSGAITSVPLNSKFDGSIAQAGTSVAFAFEGIQGINSAISIKGQGGLRPLLRILDSSGTDVLGVAESDAGGTAALPQFVPPSSGQYLVEVSGSASGPTGTFTGSLTGKVPKSMKSAKFADDAVAGDPMTFFALAGTKLSGQITIETKPHPFNAWYVLIGPSGQIVTKYNVTYSGFNKHATLKNVVLPETGTYQIAPSQPTFLLSGSVKLAPPKGGANVIHVGTDPFVAALTEPVLAKLPAATTLSTITVSGTVTGAQSVEIVADPNIVVAPVVDGAFSANLSLVANQENVIFATAIGANGTRSPAAVARVINDNEPPILNILTPINNASLVGATVNVSGVIGDRLTPELGVTVTVNGVAANAEVGYGGNGSFERRNIAFGTGTTVLTVIAKDGLGNQVTKNVSIKKATTSSVPSLSLISGDGQSGTVGTELAQPLIVKVLTATATPFANKLVEFVVSRGNGALGTSPGFGAGSSRVLIATDASGQASLFYRLGDDQGFGTNRVSVSSAGVTGVAEFSLLSTKAPTKAITAVDGSIQIGPTGSELPRQLVARVTDGTNPIKGATVHFRVLTGGGTILGESEQSVATDDTGAAKVAWRLGKTPGAQRVIASVDGVAEFASFDARGVQPSLALPTSLTGVVYDLGQQTLVGATVNVFLNGTLYTTVATGIDGRFTISAIPNAGIARIAIDGSTVSAIGATGAGTAVTPTFKYGGVSVASFALARGASNVLPTPILIPQLDQGSKTYNGAADVVFNHANIDGFKVTLPASTVVTLANGTTVPGAAGSVAISVATVHTDDLPVALPDARGSLLGLFVDPPLMKFGTPLPIEIPNILGAPEGTRATLLQFNSDSRRFEIAGDLVSNGKVFQTELGAGLTRSGYAAIAWLPTAIGSRIDCAGLALQSFSRTLGVASDELEHDVSHAASIESTRTAVTDAITAFDAKLTETAQDSTITAAEWTALRATLGKLESAILLASNAGGKPGPILGAASLADGWALAIQEATSSACGASVVTAATDAKAAYDTQLKVLFESLGSILEARGDALDDLDATVLKLTTVLGPNVPAADALTQLATANAELAPEALAFDSASADFAAKLAMQPDVQVTPIADGLAAVLATFPGAAGVAGSALRCSGQIALGTTGDGVAIHGLPIDNGLHEVLATSVAAAVSQFANSAPALTSALGGASNFGLVFNGIPQPTPVSTTIGSAMNVNVGSSASLALTAAIANSTPIDAAPGALGTTWRSSNPAAATVSADGLVSAVGPGNSFVSASHLDIPAVRTVTGVGNFSTTIFGIAQFSGGIAAANALIKTPFGTLGNAGPDGSFSFNLSVPSVNNTFILIAAGDFFGQTNYGVVSLTIEKSGPVDAGILTLTSVGNVILGTPASMVSGSGSVANSLTGLNNGIYAPNGTAWNSIFACYWSSPTPTIEFDLGKKVVFFSGTCQADDNDTYIVEVLETSSNTWKTLWNVPNFDAEGNGLTARPGIADITARYEFPTPMIGTKVRLRAGVGDGNYGVSELALFGVTVP